MTQRPATLAHHDAPLNWVDQIKGPIERSVPPPNWVISRPKYAAYTPLPTVVKVVKSWSWSVSISELATENRSITVLVKFADLSHRRIDPSVSTIIPYRVDIWVTLFGLLNSNSKSALAVQRLACNFTFAERRFEYFVGQSSVQFGSGAEHLRRVNIGWAWLAARIDWWA